MLNKYKPYLYLFICSLFLTSCSGYVKPANDCGIYIPTAYSKQYIESPEHQDEFTCNRMGPFVIYRR